MSEQTPVAEQQEIQLDDISPWVTFTLDEEHYAIEVITVQEILRYSEIVPVPGSPAYVQGIINRRGQIITIVDPRVVFGLQTCELNHELARIIIIETVEHLLGVLVDAVGEVRPIPRSKIETAPSVGTEQSAKYITGVYKTEEGNLVILLDLVEITHEG